MARRSAAQKRATAALVRRNKARSRKTTTRRRRPKAATRRRPSLRRDRRGGLSTGSVLNGVNDLADGTASLFEGAGALSVLTSPTIGVSTLHPLGGLQNVDRPAGKTTQLRNPFLATPPAPTEALILTTQLNAVQAFADPGSYFSGGGTTFTDRAKSAGAVVSYNLRSLRYRENILAAVSGVGVGIGARFGANLVRTGTRMLDRTGKRLNRTLKRFA